MMPGTYARLWLMAGPSGHTQYDADPERLKISFANYGQISSWFNMIGRRGMTFVTFVSSYPPSLAQSLFCRPPSRRALVNLADALRFSLTSVRLRRRKTACTA